MSSRKELSHQVRFDRNTYADRKFELPEPAYDNSYLYSYLTKERGLSKEVVDFMVCKELIYESRHYHNIVFKGNDKGGITRFASMRGVFDRQGKPFKCDVAGNDKRYGVNIANDNSSELIVFEAAIDMMSYMDIFNDYESNMLALGMLGDAPLETFIKEHTQIKSIRFCLDGDEPGREAARCLICKRNSCTIDVHYLKQREALNTALPIGVRQVETMRTMLTQSLAVLMPFNVQELNDAGGNYYGINQVSKNINIGNRKKLINGNGFTFGVPGSGKSFFCKMEMGSVFLSGDDEIIVIDPMNEYFDVAHTYGGTVVNMSTYTDNYVNPLSMDVWNLDQNDTKGWVREKGEFMLGLCEQCIGDSLNSRQKSIIDRCVRKMYIDIARSREKYIPVMSDFYEILMAQPEEEAKEIALSLELFVNGSLNIFNHQTNVDVDNRFVVYGIRDLGTELSPITMLVMMELIQQRIVENGKRGKATWLYIDEFHVLLNSEYSAKYLQQLWKKVRKQGGLCTGITQNVVDLLQNYTATTMLANSEFVALLKQANTDSAKMAEVIGVSDAQLRFVTNSQSGMGLLKCGNVVIPFDNQIGKDTSLYKLYNTNIHERIAEQKARKMVDTL